MNLFNRIKGIVRNPFIRDTLQYQFGSVGAMLVQAISGVILARLLGPHEYGRFAIVMSMAAVGSVLLGAGAADAMAPVLSRARHSGDDSGLRDAILFLGKFVLATACIVLVLGLTMPSIAEHLYGDRLLGWFGLAVLAGSAISTLLLTPTQLGLQVFDRIGRLSVLTFTDQAFRQAFVVGLAFGGLGVLGASYGHLFGAMIVLVLSVFYWRSLRRQWAVVPSVRELWHTFPGNGKQYIRPTLWVLADRNLAMLYGSAPIAIAALFLSTTDISYFKIALGWVTLALAVLSPVSVLLNTELARIQVQEPLLLRSRFVLITLTAVCASALVTLVAALIARPVFGLLYGAEYLAAVPLVYWLIPFGALFGLGIALGPMWRAVNKVNISIAINLLVLGFGAPLAFFALKHWGSLGAVSMVTGWYTVSHAMSFVWLLRELRRSATLNVTL